MAVSTDSHDRVFVFQRSAAHPVLVFSPTGDFLYSWGREQFTAPHGLRVAPDDTLYLTDNGDHRVLHYTQEGHVLQTIGVRGVPGNDSHHFNRPADVAFGRDGSIYIADGYGNARVVRLNRDNSFRRAWGRHGTAKGAFHLVHSVAVGPDNLVYVADRENRRVQIFTPEGAFRGVWGEVGYPFGLAFRANGEMVIADGVANTVSIHDRSGNRLVRWGGTGSAPGKFRRAHQCCVDRAGAIYVAEVAGRRVQKFLPG